MVSASAYILLVRHDRRETLLTAEPGWFTKAIAAEPVPTFNHSRRAPLIVLASFEDGYLTHVGDARKGGSAGTDLVRLNMLSLDEIGSRISFEAITEALPNKFRTHFEKVSAVGGLLPPKTLKAVVDVLTQMDASLGDRLDRLSASRERIIADLSGRVRENLAYQKEALTTALEIAGVGTHSVQEWVPTPSGETTSFLDGLPGAVVREDVMLLSDYTAIPGFEAIRSAPHIAANTFESETDPSVRVTVLMANRLPLEEQTGADLIYYNETYRSFILVQYKALEKRGDEQEFRWTDGDQFCAEIDRMDVLLEELSKSDPDLDPDGFRFSNNPFFLKFCSRVVFNPDDRGMFPGLYLPHGLWKVLAASNRLKGARGGNVLTQDNVGRRLAPADFTGLVAGAWVGTTITQSASLDLLIKSVLETGRTLTFAIKRKSPPPPSADTTVSPLIDQGNTAGLQHVLVSRT